MTAGVRDLHLNHPNKYITEVRTSASQIWEHNKYITKIPDARISHINDKDPYNKILETWEKGAVPKIKLEYPLIHRSNTGPSHFTEGYTDYIETALNIRIRNRIMKGHIELSNDEKKWVPQIQEITGLDQSYWIVVNGGKMDFTAKWWDPMRMQKVVSHFKNITFVQVGEGGHNHPLLQGSNVINLVGKTNMRQLIRLIYHSSGVICPVTLAMHLAAAVPARRDKCYGRSVRPCVVIAGGREPSTWEAYCNHAYLHTCGMLDCCDNGGCWKSRVLPLEEDKNDEKNKSLCIYPTVTENNIIIPKCLHMITVDKVIEAIEGYLP